MHMRDAKFHHMKGFENAMVEEFETNSCQSGRAETFIKGLAD